MEKKSLKPLSALPNNTQGRVREIQGGHGLHQKLQVMGIGKGETVTVISRQPFYGPITIAVGNSQLTIGRGMANKILVEVMPDKKDSSRR